MVLESNRDLGITTMNISPPAVSVLQKRLHYMVLFKPQGEAQTILNLSALLIGVTELVLEENCLLKASNSEKLLIRQLISQKL